MVYFRVLGPLSVEDDQSQPLPLKPTMQRRLLAALLAKANECVALEDLMSALWGMDCPPAARKTIQVYVRRLRIALGAEARIVHEPAGYRIVVEPGELDAVEFSQLAHRGRLGEALGLWRGRAFEDVRDFSPVSDAAHRLDEERLRVEAVHIAAELEAGRHHELLPHLRELTEAHPYREDLRGHLMLALYRAGRQAEALEVYLSTRKLLTGELGVEPGPELRRLHEAILRKSPALDLSGSPPHELPNDSVAFVGRGEELAQLDAMVANGTPVVISAIAGTAGVGKTALAVHWAHKVRDLFPGGQLYVNLNGFSTSPPTRPIEALSSMLRSVGVPPERVPTDEAEAAGLFRSRLAGRRMLLLLDNAKSAEQVRPLLPGGADNFVLITSRNNLSGLVAREGARRLNLDVLTKDEAEALLTQLLGAQRAASEPRALADLAAACAYLPLALRVAAANLNDHPHRSIAAHVQALLRGDRLGALAIEDDPHTAVQATFDQSYHDIAPDIRRTFCFLGLVPGPDFTVDAVAVLADLTAQTAHYHVSRLANAHLLSEVGLDRYSFHDLLRTYARGRAELEYGGEQISAGQRLYGWYLQHADAVAESLYANLIRFPRQAEGAARFDSPSDAVRWMDAERANLVGALQQATDAGLPSFAWRLAGALRGYFARRNHLGDWQSAAQAGLEAAISQDDRQAQALMHLMLAHACQARSELDASYVHLTSAIEAAHASGWRELEATCLGNLGGLNYENGRLDEADQLVERSLHLCNELGYERGVAAAPVNLGIIANKAGRLNEARRILEDAIPLNVRLGSAQVASAALTELGDVQCQLGRGAEALISLERALEIKRQIGDRLGEALAMIELAKVHLGESRYESAIAVAESATVLARDVGSGQAEVLGLVATGQTLAAMGDIAKAAAHHADAVQIADGLIGGTYPKMAAVLALATTLHEMAELQRARQNADSALALARQSGYRVAEGQALTLLARIEFDRRNVVAAGARARAALLKHRETGYRQGETESIRLLRQLGEDVR